MRKAPHITALLVACLAMLFGLSACGSGSGSGSGKEGGTLKATYASFPDYLDPALAHSAESWTAVYNTYIPLLTYAHAGGEAGSEVIPGLAKAMPKITDGGKRYTLTLRKGLKYSDGQPVKASDFAFALERLLRLNSSGTPFYTDIVGAEELAGSKQGPLAGVKTDDKTGEITIELKQPRGTMINELALPFVAPLPADTPVKDLTAEPPPATGPYVITKSQPGRGWEYERNPQWKANNAKLLPQLPSGHVDRIEIDVVRNSSTQVADVEQGRYDWMGNAPPADLYATVKEQFEGSQFRVEPTVSNYFFWMNTRQAPFDDLRVRQAVNYALDPAALERIYAGQLVALQQVLPPGMPGHKEFTLYPHDMQKAKQLFAEADPADRSITVWTDTESPNDEAGEYLEQVLNEVGFQTKLKILNPDNYFGLIGNESTPDLDIGWASWFQDYPSPNNFFELLDAASIFPTGSLNLARFDDPKLNAKIAQLAQHELSPKVEAEYAQLDREAMEQAPWAPYGASTFPTFVSSEIDLDKVIFNPTFSQDLTSFQFK